ncbi:HAMP domain-containing sensor histidine kinase [Plantibacter sp. VKM Ac-2880]|uniref:sensor histidine kinase n=1 Tax=Plantibacter sp. VKM Ac-2880 TaxID=2783827 RepID=UPI001E55116B|nr:ATP-binding protein [Plantibacter sp. VKM Ac-2880]
MNLVHIAIVHNVQGATVHVTTTLISSSNGPDLATLSVENTGAPASPELAMTLTEPFRRGTDRIRGGHNGTGLGLAIVKSIVHAHDGRLTISPQPSGGLKVSVILPGANPGPSLPGTTHR